MNGWATSEFERSGFHDARVRKSISKAAEAAALNRGTSHSGAVGNGLRQATGDAFGSERTSPELLLDGHKLATLDRCRDEKIVLALHDSTSFNYSSHSATTGLGPLNDNPATRGIHAHGSLAVSVSGLPLGLLSACFWTRVEPGPVKLTGSEKRALPIEEKESYKWLRSAEQTTQALLPFLDGGGLAILIGDRDADIIEFFARPRHRNLDILVRSCHPRKVETADGPSNLEKLLASVAECGEYDLTVPRQSSRPERRARMALKFVKATLVAPKYSRVDNQVVWVVRALETGAPKGTPPLSWTLISTMSVSNFNGAKTLVDYYKKRWIIETLHYTLKTGCLNVERFQFDDYHTLANALAFSYVVAWQILWLMYWSREHPDDPAESHLNRDELLLLRLMSKKPVNTIREAMLAVAQLGGYIYYPKAGPPGVKLLCAGQRRLNDMVAGARLIMDAEKI